MDFFFTIQVGEANGVGIGSRTGFSRWIWTTIFVYLISSTSSRTWNLEPEAD